MADRGPVKIREGRIKVLLKLYLETERKIYREILTSTEAGRIQRAKVLTRINSELESLGVDVDKWVRDEIPRYYKSGADTALEDLRRLGVDLSSRGGAAINREALKALTDETALSFAETMTAISRGARAVLDDAIKQQVNFRIAQGRLTGEGRRTISDAVKAQLDNRGFAVLTDRAGKRWQSSTYAEMLVRTKGVEARNQGLANRMLQYGYDLVQITNHGTDHKACAKYEGKILSLTGRTSQYPSLETAKSDGLFHPNCEHAMNVINPRLARRTSAYNNPYNNLRAR